MVENNQRNNKLHSIHISVSTKTILLEYSHTHWFASCLLSMAAFTPAELSSGDRDHLACQVKNIYYLPFTEKVYRPDLKSTAEIGFSSACPCPERENEAGLESSDSACPVPPMELKMRAEQKELTRAPSSPQQEADRQSQRRTGSH